MSRARVAVVGARGRMGCVAVELLRGSEEFELAAEIQRDDELESCLREARAELALDLTRAGLGAEHGFRMLACGVRPVIGTSGVTPEQNLSLDNAARECGLGGLVVPNFSLGAWILTRACELIAEHFEHAEIVEMHHPKKLDAPSATAAATAEGIAAVHGKPPSSVPIHSLRLSGLIANQEVHFGGQGEVLVLRHETYDRASFAPGILAALRHARTAHGVARGLGAALE